MHCLANVVSVRYLLPLISEPLYLLVVEYAASFFLLGDRLRDAVQICLNQLDDVQLAIAITRAYEGDGGPVLSEILEGTVLPKAAADGNRWMASWAFWMLNRHDSAVRALVVCHLLLSSESFSWSNLLCHCSLLSNL